MTQLSLKTRLLRQVPGVRRLTDGSVALTALKRKIQRLFPGLRLQSGASRAELPLKTRILRQLPGLRRHYSNIALLIDQRIEAVQALEAALALAHAHEAERDALRAEVTRLEAVYGGALALAHAHEAERNALRVEVTRIEAERDARRAEVTRLEAAYGGALVLAHAHEAERDALRSVQVENVALAERLAGRAEVEEHIDLILKRMAAQHIAVETAIANVSAGVLGAGARQEELLSRLVRGLHGGASASAARSVELYLDLLEASLTGLLLEDDSQSPWTGVAFDPALRAIGRDWPRQAATMIGVSRMRNLRMLTMRAVETGVPGDFIETGVWRGGACIYAKGVFEALGATERRVFVADSFCGLPEPDTVRYPADAGDVHHTYAPLAVSRETVMDNFRRYGLLDERVVFVEGWFKDTLPTAPIERLAVLRLDGDMYESTMDALLALYDKVSPGGFVIVDDYVLKPCAQAVDEFRAARGITAPLEPVDGAAIWWRVQG